MVLAIVGLTTLAGASFGSEGSAPNADCEPSAAGHVFRNLPAPYAPTTSTEIVHTQIDGHDFFVPQLLSPPPIGCGAEEGGILLRVLLPNLAPYSENTAEQFAAQRGHGRKMNVLRRKRPPPE